MFLAEINAHGCKPPHSQHLEASEFQRAFIRKNTGTDQVPLLGTTAGASFSHLPMFLQMFSGKVVLAFPREHLLHLGDESEPSPENVMRWMYERSYYSWLELGTVAKRGHGSHESSHPRTVRTTRWKALFAEPGNSLNTTSLYWPHQLDINHYMSSLWHGSLVIQVRVRPCIANVLLCSNRKIPYNPNGHPGSFLHRWMAEISWVLLLSILREAWQSPSCVFVSIWINLSPLRLQTWKIFEISDVSWENVLTPRW